MEVVNKMEELENENLETENNPLEEIVENVSSSLFDDDYLFLVYLLFIYIVRTCTKSGALCT